MDVTAPSDATISGSTDLDLVGMVVEALAMTRASSMDVESIRKIVVVCPSFFFSLLNLFPRLSPLIDFHTLSVGYSTIVEDGAYQSAAEANPPGGSRFWS